MTKSTTPSTLMSRDEQGRWSVGNRDGFVYDVEVFPNYFCATFFDGVTTTTFDHTQLPALAAFVNDTAKVLIGFNNAAYDDPLMRAICEDPAGMTTGKIYALSGLLIADWKAITPEQSKQRNHLIYGRAPWAYSIDLFEVNNRKSGLKEFQCRLGLPTVAESPAAFDQPVTADEILMILRYNRNDVRATEALLKVSRELIELRHRLVVQYNLFNSVYVKSDAKIAELFMLTMIYRVAGVDQRTLKNLAVASPNNLAWTFPITDLVPTLVAFSTPTFQELFATLTAGSVARSPKGKLELVTELPGNQAVINGLVLTFGCGGLHSGDEAGVFHRDDTSELWDVDVTSFYPGMMIAYGIKPMHILAVFTAVLKELRDARVAAKNAKDTRTADSLKLIINSIFGKLGDCYSALRDDRACMQVTIGGQLLLLMLIEKVALAGATVLSANTDGLLLRVPNEKADAIYAALREWERRTTLSLEEQEYLTVARRDVNNYVAISTKMDAKDRNKIKTKGAYNAEATKRSGSIIQIAVQEHLRTGTSIAEIINGHDQAADFLFYQRAQIDGHFNQGGQRLPRTIRWYAAGDSAEPIHRVSANGKSRVTVPHAHHASLAMELPYAYTLADLPGLNRQYYIDQAQKLLTNALASIEVELGTQQARALQEMGLTLLPQREGKNPAGIALDDITSITELAKRRSGGWAVVTGAITQTLVLDLDLLSALDPKLTAILSAHPTLTAWHGDGTAADVRSGGKRGAVIYHYDGQDARIATRATKAWLDKYGFEVGFGKKVQTAIGQHRTAGDDYVQDGVVVEAPAELIDYLGLRLGPPRKSKSAAAANDTTDAGTLDRLRLAADAVLGAGWASPFATREGFRGVEGKTPGHEKPASLRLWVRGGRVGGHTFHTSYDTTGTVALVQAEYDRLRPDSDGPGLDGGPSPDAGKDGGGQKQDRVAHLDPSDVPAPPTEEDQRTATDCAQAFDQIQGIGAIIGTTGTGKSWQATKRAIERHDRGERTLLVAPDKEGIEQMRRYTLDHWTKAGRDPKDLHLQILTSTSASDDADDEEDEGDDQSKTSKTGIRKSTMIVITHHHYASRKPLTTKLYSVQYWVEEHAAEVILDEGDLFVERQNCHLQLDARYTLIGGRERGQWTRSNHCPSAKGTFRCKGCTKRSGGRTVNLTTHHAYRTPIMLMPSQFDQLAPEEFGILPENLPLDQTIDLPGLNLRLSSLAQTPGYLAQRDFSRQRRPPRGEQETPPMPKQEMLTYLRDLIDCSHLPTMVDPRLVNDQQQIVEDDPQQLALRTDAEGKPLLDGVRTATWKFPYFLCDTRYLLLYDRAATFFLMQSASRFIIMSATIGDQHLEFLRNCANGKPVVTVTIPAPTRNPLDQVVIIGHQGRIEWKGSLGERAAKAMGCDYSNVGLTNRTTIERLGNTLTAAGKPPLVFMPTKEDSSAVFSHMKERGWNYYIEGEYRMHSGQAVAETQATDGSMALLSYARGSLGTGANLPQYDVVVVDGTVRRPHYLFNPALKTEDAYLEAQESDRVRIMVQNIGRILRGTGVKYVFVVGITPAQVTKLALEVERLAKTKTASWFTGDDTVRAMAALVASVKAGQLVVPVVQPEEPKGRSQQSRKQRAVLDADPASAVNESEFQARFEADIAMVETLARAGVTWRTAARKVNASRLPGALRSVLKAAFTAAKGVGPGADRGLAEGKVPDGANDAQAGDSAEDDEVDENDEV